MKKIGLLILALVVALGGLGAGYAMWSDEINIEGTVNTGTVDLNVTSTSSQYIWKTENHGIACGDRVPAGIEPVASAVATAGEDAVTFTFSNLFPLEGACNGSSYCAGVTMTYEGTIPVHAVWDWRIDIGGELYTIAELDTAEYGWLKELMAYYATVSFTAGGQTYVADYNVTGLENVQLHTGDKLTAQICIEVPQTWYKDTFNTNYVTQDANTQADLSGKSFSFVGKIIAYQWNEAAPEVGISTPNTVN